MTAPILGSKAVPVIIRIVIAGLVAMAIYVGVGSGTQEIPEKMSVLVGMAFSETVIGALAGLTARFTLDAAMTAGQVAGFPMGLGFSQMADPFNGVPSTALGRLFTIAALGYAVNLGLHREAIIWLFKSQATWPAGSDAQFSTMLPGFLRMIADSISMGIRLSFPVLAAVTFGHITLGIVGKSAPQLNLASVGFSIAILCGGAALFMSVQPAAEYAANLAVNTLTR